MKITCVHSKYLPEYAGPAVRANGLYQRISDAIGLKTLDVLCSSEEYSKPESYCVGSIAVERIVCQPLRADTVFRRIIPKRLRLRIARQLEAIETYKKLATRTHPDLVHVFGTSGVTTGAIHWASRNQVPLFIELVNPRAIPHQRFAGFYKPKLSKRSMVVAISKDIMQFAGFSLEDRNLWLRPNPFDAARFTPDTKRQPIPFSVDWQNHDSDVNLSAVAKFMPRKNQMFLIEMMSHLPENYKLILAGPRVTEGANARRDIAYFEKLTSMISKSGLGNRIAVRDTYVDAAPIMKASDIYLMPQLSEGLGTPMLEAMACGVPVLANEQVPAFVEWIKPGVNGDLAPLDAAHWAKKLMNMVAESLPVRTELSAWISKFASSDIVDQGYIDLISSLVMREEPDYGTLPANLCLGPLDRLGKQELAGCAEGS